MERLKYIVTDRGDFAIFTALSAHRDVARSLYGKPVGAGFCNFAVGYKETPKDQALESTFVNVHCWGESISLGIVSREEDEKFINKQLNPHA